jgi:two-component system LytT family response regulator
MIKCVVVDDEPLARSVIERYIVQTPGMQLLQSCANAVEAYIALEKQEVDLLFLDIRMPVVNGMEFFRKLTARPAVIFTTAFAEFAADSYELDAVDYLLKPVTFQRFKKSLDKYGKLNQDQPDGEKDYLFIKLEGRLKKLLHKDIIYAESMKDYLKMVTAARSYVTHLSMKALVELLPPAMFVRVHRSYIVNLNYVEVVGKKEIEMAGVKIPVGENYRLIVKDLK